MPRAVAKAFDVHSKLVQKAQRQIGQRCPLRVRKMAITSKTVLVSADDNDWHAIVIMDIAVAHSFTVQDNRPIQ